MAAAGSGCSVSMFRVCSELVAGSGAWLCLVCSILCGFVGRAGGIENALRIRNVRGAHELYESPARKQG